jgi:hypothetical protein
MSDIIKNTVLGLLALITFIASAGEAEAQIWKNTPFDTGTWRLPSPPPPQMSHFGIDPVQTGTRFTIQNNTGRTLFLELAYESSKSGPRVFTERRRVHHGQSASWQVNDPTAGNVVVREISNGRMIGSWSGMRFSTHHIGRGDAGKNYVIERVYRIR